MNKREFIEKIKNYLGYDEDKCIIINNIIEDTFLIGKSNKKKMVNRFMDELKINEDESNKIYNTSMRIIMSNVIHPFIK